MLPATSLVTVSGKTFEVRLRKNNQRLNRSCHVSAYGSRTRVPVLRGRLPHNEKYTQLLFCCHFRECRAASQDRAQNRF
jgi:hypothetical protein